MQHNLTNLEAHLLAGNGYRLVDADDTIFGIHSVDDVKMYLFGSRAGLDKYISIADIGTDYHVLCHPLSRLTTEIEGIGVPLKILKTGGTNANVLSRSHDSFMGNVYSICDNEEHELRYSDEFGFERRYRCELRSLNQDKLNKKLHEWHFDTMQLIERGIGKEITL